MRSGPGVLVLALATLVVPVACSSSSSVARHACDPLAAVQQPISLHHVLGVGKDATGTLYVVDELDNGYQFHVFVSSQGELYRQRTGGVGEVTTPTSHLYAFKGTEHDPEFALEVLIEGGTTRMGVLTGPFAGKTFTIGEQGEELTLLGAGAIAGMPLHNLPGDIVVEYAAQLADQRVLVVTRPEDDWTYDSFRLFLGPVASVVERRVDQVLRASDGGSTKITFELDGSQAVASFPVVFVDGTFKPGQATLTAAGKTENLTRLASAPSGAAYQCF